MATRPIKPVKPGKPGKPIKPVSQCIKKSNSSS
jgi:hypothetical protein